MKKILLSLVIALSPTLAFAQTATPVVPGTITTSGCPSPNLTPCFVQNSSSNPLFTTSSGSGTGNVNINQVGGNTVLTGAGATGTGSQRTTVAQDPTTIAGSAPGTAGTPSANVLSVQGVVGGTDQAISIDQTTPGTTNGVVVNPTSVAGAAIVPVVSQGASTLLGKASPGNLYTVYATATADSWLMVFNSTSAPTNGSTTAGTASGNLQDCVKVPSGTTTSIGGLPMPERFSVGIYYAISSTACATLTLATTAFIKGMQQ